MIVYIVTARYCEDDVICGVALDKETAEKIYENEEILDPAPDCVWIEEWNTDDYAPLNAGYFPFNVDIYEDGEVKIKPESAAAMGHERRVIELRRGGRKLSSYTVVAKDESQALQIATSMQKCQGK